MEGRVGAVVALKPFARAKTRITGVDADLRIDLVRAMAVDTLTALRSTDLPVVVISDEPGLHETVHDAGLDAIRVVAEEPSSSSATDGLNHALTQGARILGADGCGTVLACVADLPAVAPEQLRRVIRAHHHAGVARSFLTDVDGVGTTMLLATGVDLDPLFQGGSAERHLRSGAGPLTDSVLGGRVPGARQDVDDLASLDAALRLGVGTHTRDLVRSHPELRRPRR